MRLLVEFMRHGPARYVSHLDMQRAVMRAVRRAGLSPEYSQGFNPHMLLSFASALPVGMASDSEYFELRLAQAAKPQDALCALKQAMPEGIAPVFACALPEHAPKPMASVRYASYEARMREPADAEMKKLIEFLLQSDMIEMTVKKDGRESVKNIRPLIAEAAYSESGHTLRMLLKNASDGHLKADTLMDWLAGCAGHALPYEIKRTGLYTVINGKLSPLRDLCGA